MAQRFSSGSPFESQIGFCRALRVDNRILISGTAPLTPNGISHAPGDPGRQAHRCLEIIVEAVESLGGRKSDVVRTQIFLTCAQDWEAVGAVHGEFFGLVRPTATCVVVSALLRPEWCVEIEAEAVIPDQLRIDECDILDRSSIEDRCQILFNGSTVVSWGVSHEPALLPGFVARQGGQRVGFASYHVEDDSLELVTIEACIPLNGIGTALLNAVEGVAQKLGCKRFWLISTNDNLDALRFFQRRGLGLVAVHCRAVDLSRRVKPQIPLVGFYKIPVHDELVLEKYL